MSAATVAGDGTPPPLDGQAKHCLAVATAAIATAADILYTGDLVEIPPVFRLTAGNVAGEHTKQHPSQDTP